MKNIKKIRDEEISKLVSLYDKAEAKSLVHNVFKHLLGNHYLILENVPEEKLEILYRYFKELETGKPLQYIIGEVDFLHCKLKVSPAVLIPRPETEWITKELIEQIKTDPKLYILDVGTGSGCIAIALKKNMPQHEIFAIDKFQEALSIAKKNAKKNETNIHFIQHDILDRETFFLPVNFDIIVSNPPYIPEKEKIEIHKNVMDFEPQHALFVPTEDPFIFYTAIVEKIKKHQKKETLFYFEVHTKHCDKLLVHLATIGLKDIILKRDLFNRPRLIIGHLSF